MNVMEAHAATRLDSIKQIEWNCLQKSEANGTFLHDNVSLISSSLLFNAKWYLAEYPDVARAGMDPAQHYLQFGVLEGRDPGPNFSSINYLRANPDVQDAGINPLIHYIKHGEGEGRLISTLPDSVSTMWPQQKLQF